jgi:hypothetical protein
MPKKRSPKQIMKAHAWDAFSRYIRLRDGLVTMGSKEQGKCFTCGRVTNLWSRGGGQAGHFEEGRGNAILFEETNCHLQDYHCNVGLHGNQKVYEAKMRETYGQDEIDRLDILKRTTKEYSLEDYTNIRDEYKELYEDAMRNN